ncbi:MAG: hypothetical protein R3276_04080 [Marinobacter sp.]|nr:hypothetical protein [Marinobacter sp.]
MPQGSNMTLERWHRLMDTWSFRSNEDTFHVLLNAYSEPGRHYHSVAHVDACLYHLDRCTAALDHPEEVELALWFHDAVYKPLATGNEQKSADWAYNFLLDNAAGQEKAARVHRLIMVTEHNAPTCTTDESILVDIDLAILGSTPDIYDVFERGVRQEYCLVPQLLYREKRMEVLRGFLDRDRIYHNEPFTSEREELARKNLASAIARLEAGG